MGPLPLAPRLFALSAAAGLSVALVACASGGEDGAGGAGGAGSTATSSSDSTAVTSTSVSTSVASTSVASSSSEAASSSSSTGSGGPVCGDGVIESPEQCEGNDFNGKTCASFGLSAGDLICNPFCGIVVSGCVPKESCTNQQDDDQDGDPDCDDSDCSTAPACADSCAAPKSTSLGAFEFGNNIGRPDTLTTSCGGSGGREVVYQFITPNSADVAVNLFFADFDAVVSIRTACGDVSSEIVCKNDLTGTGPESVSFPAVAGQKYFLVLEAADDGSGSFDFDISEVTPESWCDDLDDNDFDGLLDCDDPSDCKGTSFSCQPGTGALGTSCFQPNDCQANQGDPICLTSQLGFIGGYCSEFCDLTANDCPGDGQCKDLGLSLHGVCFDGCNTTIDCQPGYVCLDEGLPTKVCDRPPEVACNDNHDNDSDGFVDCEDPLGCATSPSCAPGATPTGGPCQLHNDCAATGTDPYCIDQFTFGWPGGYCSEFCTLNGSDCSAGNVCSGAVKPNESTSPNGLCLHVCASQTDCRPGFTCTSDGTNMVCMP